MRGRRGCFCERPRISCIAVRQLLQRLQLQSSLGESFLDLNETGRTEVPDFEQVGFSHGEQQLDALDAFAHQHVVDAVAFELQLLGGREAFRDWRVAVRVTRQDVPNECQTGVVGGVLLEQSVRVSRNFLRHSLSLFVRTLLRIGFCRGLLFCEVQGTS